MSNSMFSPYYKPPKKHRKKTSSKRSSTRYPWEMGESISSDGMTQSRWNRLHPNKKVVSKSKWNRLHKPWMYD